MFHDVVSPDDYEGVSDHIILFDIGDTHQTHTITINDDYDCELVEYFISSITADDTANVVVIQPEATIWIFDDLEPECGECWTHIILSIVEPLYKDNSFSALLPNLHTNNL